MSIKDFLTRAARRLQEGYHRYLGEYHLRRGHLQQARHHLLRAVDFEQDQDPSRARQTLGKIYLLERSVVRTHPDEPPGHPFESLPEAPFTTDAEEYLEQLPHGDFTGAEEQERFAALPPIRPEDYQDVDWDRLARQL